VSITPESAHDLARVFLADAYRMRLRRAGKTVEHPIAVGELLTDDRQPPTVVVAGLLHDVLEDTDVTPAELHRFGPDIASGRGAHAGYGDREVPRAQGGAAPADPRCRPRSRDRVLADKTAKLQSAEHRPKDRRMAHHPGDARWDRGALQTQSLSERLREQLKPWPER
jgi:hypothetical protein